MSVGGDAGSLRGRGPALAAARPALGGFAFVAGSFAQALTASLLWDPRQPLWGHRSFPALGHRVGIRDSGGSAGGGAE